MPFFNGERRAENALLKTRAEHCAMLCFPTPVSDLSVLRLSRAGRSVEEEARPGRAVRGRREAAASGRGEGRGRRAAARQSAAEAPPLPARRRPLDAAAGEAGARRGL